MKSIKDSKLHIHENDLYIISKFLSNLLELFKIDKFI